MVEIERVAKAKAATRVRRLSKSLPPLSRFKGWGFRL
jgi:hypothetical protein